MSKESACHTVLDSLSQRVNFSKFTNFFSGHYQPKLFAVFCLFLFQRYVSGWISGKNSELYFKHHIGNRLLQATDVKHPTEHLRGLIITSSCDDTIVEHSSFPQCDLRKWLKVTAEEMELLIGLVFSKHGQLICRHIHEMLRVYQAQVTVVWQYKLPQSNNLTWQRFFVVKHDF